jgi:hypothetical protein
LNGAKVRNIFYIRKYFGKNFYFAANSCVINSSTIALNWSIAAFIALSVAGPNQLRAAIAPRLPYRLERVAVPEDNHRKMKLLSIPT